MIYVHVCRMGYQVYRLNSLNALVFFVLYKRSYKDKHCMDFFYCFVHACVMVPSTSLQGIQ